MRILDDKKKLGKSTFEKCGKDEKNVKENKSAFPRFFKNLEARICLII
jgi:hypothetical protein